MSHREETEAWERYVNEGITGGSREEHTPSISLQDCKAGPFISLPKPHQLRVAAVH